MPAASASRARATSVSAEGSSASSRSSAGNDRAPDSSRGARPANLSSGASRAIASARGRQSCDSASRKNRWTRRRRPAGRRIRAGPDRRFRALDILQLAQPVGNAGGDILDQQGVGGVGACRRAAASKVSRIFWGSRGLDILSDAAKAAVRQAEAGSSGSKAEQGRFAAHRVGDVEPLFLGGEIDMQVPEHIHAQDEVRAP